MCKKIKLPKGTKDCLPEESYIWQYIENFLREKAKIFGLSEIRTPIFEYTELFLRGVGDTTDIVQKEMYTFNDKGNRSITLKAEGTAPTIRAFIEHSLYAQSQLNKFFYITPLFRYENVQKGRYRQHHQFGVEIFGSDLPICDSEVINIAYSIYNDMGLKNNFVYINSLGCSKCRPIYNERLREFLNNKIDKLCNLCNDRITISPLRILDCKNEKCKEILKEAPLIIDSICDECLEHFEEVKKYLDMLNINYKVNYNIVRGLDYYTRTVFEIVNEEGLALCGGGRYDDLINQLGGEQVPAIGFGMGIERLILELNNQNVSLAEMDRLDLFIVVINDEFKPEALRLCNELRKLNVKCDVDYLSRSLKSQMKYANKINAKNIIVIGEDEVKEHYLEIKDMVTGEKTKTDFNAVTIKESLNL